MELAYGPTYVRDHGYSSQRPKKTDLPRLLLLADRFQMHGAVQEFALAAAPFSGYDEALAFLCALPKPLLQRYEVKEAVRAAAAVVARALGPVEALWQAGPERLELDARVVSLSLPVVKAVLRSRALEVKSENFGFMLAELYWAEAQPCTRDEQLHLCTEALEAVSVSHVSHKFLAAIRNLDIVKDSGVFPSFVTRALWWRNFGEDDTKCM